ncbi:hypothetical protein GCK72_021843 [Caenorhabditis remanei]|uniref:F-box associated domain-containing protein n=1 Tax=Caenorhabditis remanei TaxID=31234 RepID=A0A6A5GKT5_CAERE|nr:hypothetical protein GCK72_021843 [Caenorhabditis remanei]KAF1755274.1 hypothetical protein GCK72_021843 [Caenorhabditis remanei]
MKKQIEKFHVEFLSDSSKVDINFYPSLTQCLNFELKKLEEHLDDLYMCIANGLYISRNWSPNVKHIGHDMWWPFSATWLWKFRPIVYYSTDLAASTLTWVRFLSELFSAQPTSLSLTFNCFNTEEIDRIMDCHCLVTSFEIDSDSNQEVDQKLALSILERQNATKELKISLKPTNETFQFDLNSLRNIPEFLEIGYSFWVKWEQVLDLRSNANYILRSNFSNVHFKDLIEKWKDGWTPKWNRIMIEANEILDIDSWINDPVINIGQEDLGNIRSLITENQIMHAYKFQFKVRFPYGAIIKNGYHITRQDKSIATVTVENNKIGWFILQSAEPDDVFMVYSHLRTYQCNDPPGVPSVSYYPARETPLM